MSIEKPKTLFRQAQRGNDRTLAQLNGADFYTGTLGWDSTVWDLSALNFANGKYPVLKPQN